jgi:molybdopterin-dependent oxidoreductase alpha subunit
MSRNVQIVPPETPDHPVISNIETKAAGLAAVTSTMKHLAEELGVWEGMKLLAKMNQKDGFDCSGCAWPDPDDHRSKLFEYCENGAKALAEEATNKHIGAAFFAHHSVEELSNWTDHQIGKAGRLIQPMWLPEGESHYKEISWEEAFQKIGEKLKSLSNPHEAVFYTSGRTSNEAAFMYQLFVRVFGTNNLPDCSNMCHESSGSGLSETVGIGKGSVTLKDLYEAEVIMVMGQNPGTNHPRMMSALEKCKLNGGKIININPIPEAGTNVYIDPQSPGKILSGGTQLTDQYLQVKVNGDVALLKAVMILLLNKEDEAPGSVFDLEFIREKTDEYAELIKSLRESNLQECIDNSGISLPEIQELAILLAAKRKIIICWAMGLTQHENGVHNIREIVNLLLLKGSIGKPGAGTCPVRGHSNVQGDRTMGIWEKPKEPFLASLDKRFAINTPREHGYDTIEAIEALAENKVRFFLGMGGNFISATPDSAYTGRAMQNCDLTVQVSTKLNRSHLVTGKEALILPCLGRTEEDLQAGEPQFVTVENSMGVVHSSRGTRKPASSNLKSEPAIVAGIANAAIGSTLKWDEMVSNYDELRGHIEAVIPGFENYNQRVRNPGGFYLPNGARNQKFNTPSGKAQFTINPISTRKVEKGRLILMTIRSHDQYNTTIYGLDDRYRGVKNGRRVLLMNIADIEFQGLKPGQLTNVTSHYKGKERKANNFRVVEYDIAKGCVAAYFPEANVLVPINSFADKSQTPASKFIEVSLELVN